MSTSAQTNKVIRNRYSLAALICLLFAAVYELFSHGVLSIWMLSMPMHTVLSALLFHILYQLNQPSGSWFRSLWLCAAATFTVCFCLRGVFDIYGTEFPLFQPLLLTGVALVLAALIAEWRPQRI